MINVRSLFISCLATLSRAANKTLDWRSPLSFLLRSQSSQLLSLYPNPWESHWRSPAICVTLRNASQPRSPLPPAPRPPGFPVA